AQHWSLLKAAADHARDQILLAVDEALAAAGSAGGHVSGRQSAAWKERVQTVVLQERETLDRAYGDALQAVLDYYSAHADAALGTVYEQVPVLAESAPPDRLMVGGGGFLLAQLGRLEAGTLEQLA